MKLRVVFGNEHKEFSSLTEPITNLRIRQGFGEKRSGD